MVHHGRKAAIATGPFLFTASANGPFKRSNPVEQYVQIVIEAFFLSDTYTPRHHSGAIANAAMTLASPLVQFSSPPPPGLAKASVKRIHGPPVGVMGFSIRPPPRDPALRCV